MSLSSIVSVVSTFPDLGFPLCTSAFFKSRAVCREKTLLSFTFSSAKKKDNTQGEGNENTIQIELHSIIYNQSRSVNQSASRTWKQ